MAALTAVLEEGLADASNAHAKTKAPFFSLFDAEIRWDRAGVVQAHGALCARGASCRTYFARKTPAADESTMMVSKRIRCAQSAGMLRRRE